MLRYFLRRRTWTIIIVVAAIQNIRMQTYAKNAGKTKKSNPAKPAHTNVQDADAPKVMTNQCVDAVGTNNGDTGIKHCAKHTA